MSDLLDIVASFRKDTNLFDLLPDDSDGNTEEFIKNVKNVAAKARPTPEEEEKKKKKNKRKQEAKKKAVAAKKKQILNNNLDMPSAPSSLHMSLIQQPVNGQANSLQSYQRNYGQGHSQVDRFQGHRRNNTGGDFYRRNDGGESQSYIMRNNGWDHGQGRAYVHVNGANKSREEETDKTMTYQEYEKVRIEKKKALESHPEKPSKVTLDKDFESMKLIGKKADPESDEFLYKPSASESGRSFRGRCSRNGVP